METIRPFDFVKTHRGSVGVVMVVNISHVGNPTTYSINWIDVDEDEHPLKIAWWDAHEIENLEKNMMDMLAYGVAGNCGTRGYKEHFGMDRG